jgi:hypothetical protein
VATDAPVRPQGRFGERVTRLASPRSIGDLAGER